MTKTQTLLTAVLTLLIPVTPLTARDLGSINAGSLNAVTITGGTITGTTITGVTVTGTSNISGATISGGSIDINGGAFTVGTDGNMGATSGGIANMLVSAELRLGYLSSSGGQFLCLDAVEAVYTSATTCDGSAPAPSAARIEALEKELAELRGLVERLLANSQR